MLMQAPTLHSASDPDSSTVHTEYVQRLDARRSAFQSLEQLDRRFSNIRLLTFGVLATAVWIGVTQELTALLWGLAPFALFFFWLVVRHDRIIHQRERAGRAVRFYERGLQRLEDRWMGSGTSGSRFSDPHHPYSGDLDLFGNGSVFELLCTARTVAGETCLAEWLLSSAAPVTARQRQESVQELLPRLDLREEMAILGEEVASAVRPEALTQWGRESVDLPSGPIRMAVFGMSGLVFCGFVAWGMGYTVLPLLVTAGIAQIFNLTLAKRVKKVLHGLDRPVHDLSLLTGLLERIEREPFQSPLLRALETSLGADTTPASVRIARLRTLMEYYESRQNMLVAPFLEAMLWSTHFAYAIEGWRKANGASLPIWIHAVAEFEALSALANYAHEHPADIFPDVLDAGVEFTATGLAHPLISAAQAVRNDVHIGEDRRLLVVSGSNMSGKSTLLRAVGVNIVLALAGGPVRAHSLRVSPLSLGASLRTQDSLQAGISRFYAEIQRLRQIVDLAREKPPLLFLLDEILHGTNSHDRRIGAEAVLRSLLAEGAIGFVTTHDLALTQIVKDTTLAAVNVHLEDQMEDGKMSFDYQLRPGVVEKSNALELMRAVGLRV